MEKISGLYIELQAKYELLLYKANNIYEEHNSNESYKKLLENKVDNRVIFEETEVQRAIAVSKANIKNFINKKETFDQNQVASILQVRLSQLDFFIDSASIDTIGTTLNILREFYHDVELDFERNRC